jgi:hypothetical protein
LLAVVALGACGDNIEVFEEQPSIEVAHYAALQAGKLDMLFVMDPTMGSEPARDLGNQASTLFDALAGTDVRVGVTTSDLGTTTSVDRATSSPAFNACAGAGDDGVLTVVTDATSDTVKAALHVDLGGCEFEQPLGAMARAFDNPANAGFLRDDANLLVVLMSSQDDCSVRDAAMFDPTDDAALGFRWAFRCTRFGVECDQPIREPGMKTRCHANETSRLIEHVGTYIARLQLEKPDPTRVATYALSGPLEPVQVIGGAYLLAPSCMYPNGGSPGRSMPGIRLADFTSAFENNGYGTICESNYVGQLNEIGTLAKRMAGVTCLDTAKLLDSGSQPGIQPSCAVTIEGSNSIRSLHECADDVTTDCFQVLRDVTACPNGDSLRLDVPLANPSPDEHVRARCVVSY